VNEDEIGVTFYSFLEKVEPKISNNIGGNLRRNLLADRASKLPLKRGYLGFFLVPGSPRSSTSQHLLEKERARV
jgi:hypothetical protein